MEKRLIDADALNADFIQEHTANTDVYLAVRKIIDHAPTVDAVEVVHGHYEKYDESEYCYCSVCGKPTATDNAVSWHYYCSYCGAKMDEKVSE